MRAGVSSIRVGLASIAKKDSTPFRRYLFSRLLERNRAARVADALSRSPLLAPAFACAVLARAAWKLLQADFRVSAGHSSIAVYHYGNEERAIARLLRDGTSHGTIRYRWSARTIFSGAAYLVRTASLESGRRRIVRWAARSRDFVRADGFLVGARQVEFLVLFARFRFLFSSAGVRGRVLVGSTESNPEVISALLAARSLGARTAYINHGFLDVDLGWFFQDVLCLQGQAMADRVLPHALAGAAPRVILYGGARSPVRPRVPDFEQVSRIGLVCSIAVDAERAAKVVRDCLMRFPRARIIVRPHPNPVLAARLRRFLPPDPKVEITDVSSRGLTPLGRAAATWDFAIVGESSAHLEVLSAGIPTVAMPIDGLERDRYGFVASGLVPEAQELASAAPAMRTVYTREDWQEIYRRYDPGLELPQFLD